MDAWLHPGPGARHLRELGRRDRAGGRRELGRLASGDPGPDRPPAGGLRLPRLAPRPEQQLRVFEGTGNFPSTPELYDTPQIREFSSEFLNDAPLGEVYADNALDVVAQNVGPNYNLINQEFGQALNRVSDGLESPDEAWESAIANIKRELGL
jgi:hypothetical protein